MQRKWSTANLLARVMHTQHQLSIKESYEFLSNKSMRTRSHSTSLVLSLCFARNLSSSLKMHSCLSNYSCEHICHFAIYSRLQFHQTMYQILHSFKEICLNAKVDKGFVCNLKLINSVWRMWQKYCMLLLDDYSNAGKRSHQRQASSLEMY